MTHPREMTEPPTDAALADLFETAIRKASDSMSTRDLLLMGEVRRQLVVGTEAAARIEALGAALKKAREHLGILTNEDDRFHVFVGGNPFAVDKMLAEYRAFLAELDTMLGGSNASL